jgi:hypothetical protein
MVFMALLHIVEGDAGNTIVGHHRWAMRCATVNDRAVTHGTASANIQACASAFPSLPAASRAAPFWLRSLAHKVHDTKLHCATSHRTWA